jgi:penicillin-binding protein 2
VSEPNPRIRLAVVGVLLPLELVAVDRDGLAARVVDQDDPVAIEDAAARRVLVDEPDLVGRGRHLEVPRVEDLQVPEPGEQRAEEADGDDADEIKARLAALLNLSREELDRRIADVRYTQYKPIPVAEGDAVPKELYIYVKEHQADFPGVDATVVSQRSYPNGDLAAHVLGYVGEINDRELVDRKKDGYRLGDTIGKGGAELVYEHELRGAPGVTKLQVNSSGEVVKGVPLAVVPPTPGKDVTLSIDANIQRFAEDSLKQGLEAARGSVDRNTGKHFGANAGAVVVTDPRDGSILAMASYPTYDPSQFINGIKPDVFAQLTDPASQFPLNNRALTGQYAPGSTFKLITAASAIQKGMIAGNTTIVDNGIYNVPDCKGEKCTFRNSGGTKWGRVDLRRAITVSSDVYFYSLGAKFWLNRSQFGAEGLQDTAKAFGLGARTGVLLPGDKKGVIPGPEQRKEFCKHVRCLDDHWRTGDSINMAIGQGDVLVTPLQLANAYATFANGGTLFQPKLSVEDPTKELGNVGLSPAQRQPILDGLKGVISNDKGTAYGAFLGYPDGQFPVAGKTGTAQVHGKQDTAVFAAFAPADAPQYAIAVVMEESGFGGSAAAPVARRIFQSIATGGQANDPIHLASGND